MKPTVEMERTGTSCKIYGRPGACKKNSLHLDEKPTVKKKELSPTTYKIYANSARSTATKHIVKQEQASGSIKTESGGKDSLRIRRAKPVVEKEHPTTSCKIYSAQTRYKVSSIIDMREIDSSHSRHDKEEKREPDSIRSRKISVSKIVKSLRSKKSLMDSSDSKCSSKSSDTDNTITIPVTRDTEAVAVTVDHGNQDHVECALNRTSSSDVVRASFRRRYGPPCLQQPKQMT